jgi:hypothetical protein
MDEELRVEVTDFDKNKIGMINFEFVLKFLIDLLSLLHFLLVLFIKGLNISLLTHVAVFKTIYNSYSRLYSNTFKFFQFREFMANLEKDFPFIKFKIS